MNKLGSDNMTLKRTALTVIDQAIFPFISYFSHDESLCFILSHIFFLIYHLTFHAVLRWNFLEYFSDSLLSNQLQIPEMLLSHSYFPPVYKEAVLPQRIDNIILGFIVSSGFFSKLDSLVYSIIICHKSHHHFDYLIRVCFHHVINIKSA